MSVSNLRGVGGRCKRRFIQIWCFYFSFLCFRVWVLPSFPIKLMYGSNPKKINRRDQMNWSADQFSLSIELWLPTYWWPTNCNCFIILHDLTATRTAPTSIHWCLYGAQFNFILSSRGMGPLGLIPRDGEIKSNQPATCTDP